MQDDGCGEVRFDGQHLRLKKPVVEALFLASC